jgi:hypothetical protein
MAKWKNSDAISSGYALRELVILVPDDVHNGFPGTLVLWVEQIDLGRQRNRAMRP